MQILFFSQDYGTGVNLKSGVHSEYLYTNRSLNVSLSKTNLFLIGFTTKATGSDNYMDFYCE